MADTEQDLIARSQDNVAKIKDLLKTVTRDAAALVTINHDAGRFFQSADAMIWLGAVMALHGDLMAAHGVASKALIEGYGAEMVARGPGR